MISLKEVDEKREINLKNCPWRIVLSRKVSKYLTWGFVHTPISANQITGLLFLISLVSVILFSTGRYWNSLFAIFLFHVAFFLDQSDGEVARFKKQTSLKGTYFDLMNHITINPLILIGIGAGAYLTNPTQIPSYIFLIGGFTGGYGLILNNFAKVKKYETYVNKNETQKLNNFYNEIKMDEKPKKSFIKEEIKNFFKPSIFDAIFIFGILNILPYLVLITGVIMPLQSLKRFYIESKRID